jgi:hypothetical protein
MEDAMNFNPQSNVLIQMEQGTNGLWNVNEVGHDGPLASFEDIEKCCDYASDYAKEKNGIIVQTLN